jgi:excisionase family DNA binding protein
MRRHYDFGFPVQPALRLREIETILKQTRVVVPVPSRPTLIMLIETGILEGYKMGRAWLVYETSFHKWVRSFQPEAWKKIKPTADRGVHS